MPAEIDLDGMDPLYVQLAAILRERISGGTYDKRIPPMSALKEEFGLARNTIAAALKVLMDEGLIRGVPGRGVFVVPQEPEGSGAGPK